MTKKNTHAHSSKPARGGRKAGSSKGATRRAIVDALDQLLRQEQFSGEVFAQLSNSADLPPAQFGIVQQVVRGVCEQRVMLEEEVNSRLTKKKKLPAKVRWVLMSGLYQLLYLDNVVAGKIVDECVHCVRKYRLQHFSGLVNAVLRNAAREREARGNAPVFPNTAAGSVGLDLDQDGGEQLSTASIAKATNHPDWLVQRWITQVGEEATLARCKANNQPWPLFGRCNSRKFTIEQLTPLLESEGVAIEAVPEVPGSFEIVSLPRGVRLPDLASFVDGAFYIQDVSAAVAARLAVSDLNTEEKCTILDLCAAPGGKTFTMALTALAQAPGSQVLALDRTDKKLSKIMDTVSRLGDLPVETRVADSSKVSLADLGLASGASVVMLDAPCSGTGVLGRRPDMRWNKAPSSIGELAELQKLLLRNATSLVAVEGALVYSTCSLERDENEEVVSWFLTEFGDRFVLRPAVELAPKRFVTECGRFVRCEPALHGAAGGFAARFERKR